MKNQKITGFFDKVEILIEEIENRNRKGFKDDKEEYLFKNYVLDALFTIHKEYLYKYIDYKASVSKEDFETQFNIAALEIGYEIKNYNNLKNYLENLNEIVDKEKIYFNMLKDAYRKTGEEYSDNKRNSGRRIIKQNFNTKDCIDLEMIKKIPVEIDPSNNFITISKKNITDNKPDVIEILGNSVGFPGNTHEATIKNNDIYFLGTENLNLRIENLFEDGEVFSFENIIINNNDLNNIKSDTHHYQENVSWNSDEQQAFLEFKLTFEELTLMNEIVISPGISTNKDFLNLSLESIYVTDKQGNYQEVIKDNTNLYEMNSFIFNEQNVKEITVKIRQVNGYTTKIGYLNFYLNSFQEGVNYTIPRDEKVQSLAFLGIEYNKSEKKLIYPSTFKSNKFSDEEITEHLFTKPLDGEYKKCDLNLINAQKYNINLESIETKTNTFEDESVFISKDINIGEPINSVYIKTNEIINSKEILEDIFKYYISHNNGKEWVEINPINRFNYDDTIKIFYNQNINNNFSEVIKTEEEVKNIRFKAVLKKVEGSTVTPILRGYQIIIND